MKLSSDNKTLIGYEDKQPLEVCKLWNLSTLLLVHEEVLDLEDQKDLTEDPQKLMVFSNDGLLLYMRSDNKKGIKIISL